MNIPLLEQIAAHIEAHPEGFDMSRYTNACGTTCCIAGEAVRMTTPDTFKELFGRVQAERDETAANGEFFCAGIEALGINSEQGYPLFISSYWPKQFSGPHCFAKDNQERAAIAAARIRHFIATEGRE